MRGGWTGTDPCCWRGGYFLELATLIGRRSRIKQGRCQSNETVSTQLPILVFSEGKYIYSASQDGVVGRKDGNDSARFWDCLSWKWDDPWEMTDAGSQATTKTLLYIVCSSTMSPTTGVVIGRTSHPKGGIVRRIRGLDYAHLDRCQR